MRIVVPIAIVIVVSNAVDAADEDAAYLALLAAKRKSLTMGDEDEDDAVFMDEWTDDEEIESALDDVDVFSMLVAAMNTMQDTEPQRFQVHISHGNTSIHDFLVLQTKAETFETSMQELMNTIHDCKKPLHDLMQYAHIRKADMSHKMHAPV